MGDAVEVARLVRFEGHEEAGAVKTHAPVMVAGEEAELDGRRRVTHISEVTLIDRDTDEIRLEDIFVLRDQDQDRLRHTGYIPTFGQELIAKKIFDVGVFL